MSRPRHEVLDMYYKTTSLCEQALALLSINNPKNATDLILLRSQYAPGTLLKLSQSLRLTILEREKFEINPYVLWGLLLITVPSA